MKKLLTAFIAAVLMISCVGCGNNAEIEALRKDVDELKATVYGSYDDKDSSVQKANSDSAYTLCAGDYEIPGDVESGKYDIVCKSGEGILNVHDEKYAYVISEPMNVSGKDGIRKRKNANLASGQSINISGTLVVDLIRK